jgi:hypothetical protein
MAFPDLSQPPLEDPFEQSAAQDPVIRSDKEAGYVQSRPRFTRVPDKHHFEYGGMTDADYTAIKAWEIATVYGASADTFIHPKTGSSLTVRLAAPIKYKLKNGFWSFVFDLEEV